jgi:hypothetical protein
MSITGRASSGPAMSRTRSPSLRPSVKSLRRLAEEKLPHIDALIVRTEAVKRWLEVARSCDCESVDVCGLFADPTLIPPAAGPDQASIGRETRIGDPVANDR